MVKRRKQRSSKTRGRKEFCANRAKAGKINASTAYETCSEQLSPFGGVLPLVKFFDLVGFRQIFHSHSCPAPAQEAVLPELEAQTDRPLQLLLFAGQLALSVVVLRSGDPECE
ncbi:MAG TPA: hypothetical protein ACFCUC_13805 [Desulfobacterales bacterium]